MTKWPADYTETKAGSKTILKSITETKPGRHKIWETINETRSNNKTKPFRSTFNFISSWKLDLKVKLNLAMYFYKVILQNRGLGSSIHIFDINRRVLWIDFALKKPSKTICTKHTIQERMTVLIKEYIHPILWLRNIFIYFYLYF